MSTTPIISTVPVHPPSSYILENASIPSQDNGVPYELSLLTPYSRISSSSPVPVLALATADLEKLQTPSPVPEGLEALLTEVVAYREKLETEASPLTPVLTHPTTDDKKSETPPPTLELVAMGAILKLDP